MAATFFMAKDFRRTWYTAYRPIICQVLDLVGNIAYLQGDIQRETWLGSGSWVSTGMLVNGYQDSDGGPTYTFNIMGYCRELIGKGLWSTLPYGPGYGDDVGTRFRMEIWGVRYPNIAGDPLNFDIGDSILTQSFFALSTTTDITENTDVTGWPHKHHLIDRYILGDNGWSLGTVSKPDSTKPHFTSYPGVALNHFQTQRNTGAYTINMSDILNLSFDFPTVMDKDYSVLYVQLYVWDPAAESISSSHMFICV